MKRLSLVAVCGGAVLGFISISTSLAADSPAASQQAGAQTTSEPATPTPTQVQPAPAQPAPAQQKLPYGVDDVLKLSRSKVSDDIIMTYVQTSGTVYNLKPNDIVALKQQGVSDKVVNAMLDQRRQPEATTSTTEQTTEPAPAIAAPLEPAPVLASPGSPSTPPFFAEPIENYPTPAPVEVVQPPSSTLYVIPFGPSGYRPYYRTLGAPYCGAYVIRAPGAACRVTGFGHSHSGFHSYRHR